MDADQGKGVGGIRWSDSLEWMEKMRGERWARFLDEEHKNWAAALEKKGVAEMIGEATREIIQAQAPFTTPYFTSRSREVGIGVLGTMSYEWRWLRGGLYSEEGVVCADLDTWPGGHIWYIREGGSGAEEYELVYQRWEKEGWKSKGVGPFVAVLKGSAKQKEGARVFFLEAKNTLVYWRLVSVDAKTGRGRRVHYTEKDSSINLSISRCSNDAAFLVREAGGFQQVFKISSSGVISPLHKPQEIPSTVVLGDSETGVFMWSSGGGRWEKKGALYGWKLPALSWSPESFSLEHGLLVLRSHGERAIWSISRQREPVCIWRGLGNVVLDPWGSGMIRITCPGSPPFWWDTARGMEGPPRHFGAGVIRYTVRSRDGTHIPYCLIEGVGASNRKGRGLLVIGYSAYGISTSFNTARWTPLLLRGWTICIGMFRGSGDHTPEWAQAGRLTGRIKTLEDAYAVVHAARQVTGVAARNTILYGRSAGGLWVGGLAALYPKGDVFGGIYMEVPYLDVLKTTSNPKLPLTEIETEEFGRADKRISDFAGMLKWSPMELLQENCPNGIPKLKQLVRTGENDSEVFSYEPAKWIIRTRGPRERHGSQIYFVMEKAQGHFSVGWRGTVQQATDCAVLDSWV
jgi:Prolyl oligopeptidase family